MDAYQWDIKYGHVEQREKQRKLEAKRRERLRQQTDVNTGSDELSRQLSGKGQPAGTQLVVGSGQKAATKVVSGTDVVLLNEPPLSKAKNATALNVAAQEPLLNK